MNGQVEHTKVKNILLSFVVVIWGFISPAWAGDDASGSTPFSVDLSASFKAYKMSATDRRWSRSLVHNLKYTGHVVHFVKTDLKPNINDVERQGEVYEALEEPGYFYVVPSDAMLIIGAPHPYSPGVNGFSMHRSTSKNFIVCLNLQPGGVPIHSGTKIVIGKNVWNGRLWSRFR